MARTTNEIEKELMLQSDQERTQLTYDPMVNLDPCDKPLSDKEWNAAWQQEIQTRVDEIDSGKEPLIPHDEVMASLKTVIKK